MRFFPCTIFFHEQIGSWSEKAESWYAFKANFLIRLSPNSMYNCHNPEGLNLFLDLDLA